MSGRGRDEKMPLKNRLKEYRAALNVNQQELGRLAGVSRQTISLIERGDYSPSVTLALKLAKICGVRVEDIFCLLYTSPGRPGGCRIQRRWWSAPRP